MQCIAPLRIYYPTDAINRVSTDTIVVVDNVIVKSGLTRKIGMCYSGDFC